MKFFALVALAAGHRLKFTDWFVPDQTEALKDKINLMQKENGDILADIDTKIGQADRNAHQGELG